MFAYLSRWGTRSRTTTRLRRVTAALAAGLGAALLTSNAVSPAAYAIRVPAPGGPTGPVDAPSQLQTIAAGGMPGWQITLIAAGAAVVAAVAAVLLDRARAARRHLTVPNG